MKGNFKGFNSALGIIISMIFFGIIPCFCLLAKSDAAIIIIAVVPMLIGIPPLIYAMNLPCAYDADGDRLNMKAGFDERTFRYKDIERISCRYVKSENGKAVAELTIENRFGEKSTYREIFNADITDLLNDPENTKKPQLFMLCDYVNRAKGAAV